MIFFFMGLLWSRNCNIHFPVVLKYSGSNADFIILYLSMILYILKEENLPLLPTALHVMFYRRLIKVGFSKYQTPTRDKASQLVQKSLY